MQASLSHSPVKWLFEEMYLNMSVR